MFSRVYRNKTGIETCFVITKGRRRKMVLVGNLRFDFVLVNIEIKYTMHFRSISIKFVDSVTKGNIRT